VMTCFGLSRIPTKVYQYRYRGPRKKPGERGGKPPVYRRILENEHAMIIERDVVIRSEGNSELLPRGARSATSAIQGLSAFATSPFLSPSRIRGTMC
jgi:hypothetical protein